MKKFVVMRRAEEDEAQKVRDSFNGNPCLNYVSMMNKNSESFNVALRTVGGWMRFVVRCQDIELTSWEAKIDNGSIILPTGENICFDEMGNLLRVITSNDEEVSRNEIQKNATTVVFNKNFKVITVENVNNINVTLIGWKPIYSDNGKTKCGNISYQEYLVIIGGNIDMESLYQEGDDGLAVVQLWYEYAIGALLEKNKDEMTVWSINTLFSEVHDDYYEKE